MTQNTWAMLCHLGGLSGYLFNGLGSIVVPLVLWIIKKDEFPEVDRHGKEALNFNISIAIYGLAITILTLISCVALFLSVPLILFHIVCATMAAIKANNGEDYQYPLCLRLLK